MPSWLWRASWLFLPLAWVAQRTWHQDLLTFALACLALLPLAKGMGDATGHLADRLGPVPGSLLNATFGNAAELIVGLAALRHGHIALVKGSLTGSIIGNLLLVAGASIVAGGLRFPRLRFNRLAASASISTLFLAVVALVVPSLLVAGGTPMAAASTLSVWISAVLVSMYGLTLVFQLRTHRAHLSGEHPRIVATPAEAAARPAPAPRAPLRPLSAALAELILAGAGTALASELLVGALDGTVQAAHLPEVFVGVVIVAFVGNAAEHSTALLFGLKGDLDVALGIAWESSKQIALFVAPVLVFAGLAIGAPMDLAFTRFEVAAVTLAVLALALVAMDGETHWLEGAFLLAVYVVLALGFYFVQ